MALLYHILNRLTPVNLFSIKINRCPVRHTQRKHLGVEVSPQGPSRLAKETTAPKPITTSSESSAHPKQQQPQHSVFQALRKRRHRSAQQQAQWHTQLFRRERITQMDDGPPAPDDISNRPSACETVTPREWPNTNTARPHASKLQGCPSAILTLASEARHLTQKHTQASH